MAVIFFYYIINCVLHIFHFFLEQGARGISYSGYEIGNLFGLDIVHMQLRYASPAENVT